MGAEATMLGALTVLAMLGCEDEPTPKPTTTTDTCRERRCSSSSSTDTALIREHAAGVATVGGSWVGEETWSYVGSAAELTMCEYTWTSQSAAVDPAVDAIDPASCTDCTFAFRVCFADGAQVSGSCYAFGLDADAPRVCEGYGYTLDYPSYGPAMLYYVPSGGWQVLVGESELQGDQFTYSWHDVHGTYVP